MGWELSGKCEKWRKCTKWRNARKGSRVREFASICAGSPQKKRTVSNPFFHSFCATFFHFTDSFPSALLCSGPVALLVCSHTSVSAVYLGFVRVVFFFFALCFFFFVFSWCFMHVCFFSVCMYWILMRCLSHIYIEVSDTVSWQILSVTHSKLFRCPAWDEYLKHSHVPGHVHKLAVTERNSVCLLVITLPWVKIKGFSDRRVAHPLAGRRRETQRFMGEEL